MSSTAVVARWSKSVKLALAQKPIEEFATEVAGDQIRTEAAGEKFPAMPKELVVTPEMAKALRAMPKLFGGVQPQQRRTLDQSELAAIGEEFKAIQELLKAIGKRDKDIREIVRTHQDMTAEAEGRAFPKDIRRNGNLIAEATPRDANGHYILAKPGEPEKTLIPGLEEAFQNQYTSGRTTTDLEAITRAYEAGEIDREVYLAVTVAKRVVDPGKLKAYVLKTGLTNLMAMVTRRGRASSSMNFRGLSKS